MSTVAGRAPAAPPSPKKQVSPRLTALWEKAGNEWSDVDRKAKWEEARGRVFGSTPPPPADWTDADIASMDEALFGQADVKF